MTEEDDPLLDALQVADLQALDQGRGAVYAKFVGVFLSGAGERMALLKRQAAANDGAALAAQSHALRGSAGNVGAARLSGLFHRIEKAALSGDLAVANTLLARLDAEYAAASEALLAAAGQT